MKNIRTLKSFSFVSVIVFIFVFAGFYFLQADVQSKGKPSKPSKPSPKSCDSNGICEWEEAERLSKNQQCEDCLPKEYDPLEILPDPYLQIVASGTSAISTSKGKVFQFKHTAQGYKDTWASNYHGTSSATSIGDADNDGQKEIITTVNYKEGKGKNAIYSQKILIYEDGSVGDPAWKSEDIGYSSLRDLVIADVDNDPHGYNEIVLLKDKHIEIYRIVFNENSGAYDLEFIWRCDEYDYTIFKISAGDADNDDQNEIVLAMFDVGAPIIWKKVGETWTSKTAELIPSEYWNPNLSRPFLGIDVAKVRDADNDGFNEIIAGGNNNRLMIWKYNYLGNGEYDKVFIGEDLGGFTPGVGAGDVDGNGYNEVIIGAQIDYPNAAIFVYEYDPNSNTYVIIDSALCITFGAVACADLDGDLIDEMVLSSQGVKVFEYINHELVETFNCAYGSSLEID